MLLFVDYNSKIALEGKDKVYILYIIYTIYYNM